MYIDESGLDQYVYNKWGRSPRGEPVYAEICGKKHARRNFIAAKMGIKL